MDQYKWTRHPNLEVPGCDLEVWALWRNWETMRTGDTIVPTPPTNPNAYICIGPSDCDKTASLRLCRGPHNLDDVWLRSHDNSQPFYWEPIAELFKWVPSLTPHKSGQIVPRAARHLPLTLEEEWSVLKLIHPQRKRWKNAVLAWNHPKLESAWKLPLNVFSQIMQFV